MPQISPAKLARIDNYRKAESDGYLPICTLNHSYKQWFGKIHKCDVVFLKKAIEDQSQKLLAIVYVDDYEKFRVENGGIYHAGWLNNLSICDMSKEQKVKFISQIAQFRIHKISENGVFLY